VEEDNDEEGKKIFIHESFKIDENKILKQVEKLKEEVVNMFNQRKKHQIQKQ